MTDLIINDMISDEKGHKREILLELKKLNKEAYKVMHSSFRVFKAKYRKLQQTDMWKQAKKLLLEYFTYDNILRCSVCGKVIDSRRCVIHHTEYKNFELFTPFFIKVVHPHCHDKIHNK